MISKIFMMKNPSSVLRSNLVKAMIIETNEKRQRKKRLVTNAKKYL